jgi:hypothetical protein
VMPIKKVQRDGSSAAVLLRRSGADRNPAL